MKVAELQKLLTELSPDAEIKVVGESEDEYGYLLIQGWDKNRSVTEEITVK